MADDSALQHAVEETVEAQKRRRQYDRSRVEMVRGYAEATHCRRQYLLGYFGEELPAPCGNCDNCDAGQVELRQQEQDSASGEPFPVNSRVSHTQWGIGQVLRYEADSVVVLFDQVGYKTLSVPVVLELGLLTEHRGG